MRLTKYFSAFIAYLRGRAGNSFFTLRGHHPLRRL
jgi:hypothetical protein